MPEAAAEPKTVGFVGLGTMGIEMARNLLEAGHAVRAFDVVPAAMEVATCLGAIACDRLREVGSGASLLVTMLPDTPHVEEVLLGPDGLLANPPDGGIVVDMSTISPQAVRIMSARLKSAGIDLLDVGHFERSDIGHPQPGTISGTECGLISAPAPPRAAARPPSRSGYSGACAGGGPRPGVATGLADQV